MKSAPQRLILGLGFSVLSDFSGSTAFGAATTGSGTAVRVLAAVGAGAETVAAVPKEKAGPELFAAGATVGTVLMMGATTPSPKVYLTETTSLSKSPEPNLTASISPSSSVPKLYFGISSSSPPKT